MLMRVVLTALSAKNIHKTLAPWNLKAYCDKHIQGCQIIIQEHNINDNVGEIVSHIYQSKPDVVGFSCYIWNIEHVIRISIMLKKYLPKLIIVLGGPEVSFEMDCNNYPFANYIVKGPGETTFVKIIREILDGKVSSSKLICAEYEDNFERFPSPYIPEYYMSFEEGRMSAIENQLIYYESSRGCQFACTYCLSSTHIGVSELSLKRIFDDIENLLKHGAKCIKFVDRTFNANRMRASKIFRYISSLNTDCIFHFEVAADLFESEMLQIISLMPKQRIQFEMGIQTVNHVTLAEINRTMDVERALQNIETIVGFGNCHVHVDLIAGLPYETMETFSVSINRCIKVRPHMLQLGFLKLLKGTKIRENSSLYGFVFNDYPPYEVFQNNSMSFEDIIKLKHMEKVINKFYNSGMFINSIDYAISNIFESAYQFFSNLSEFCKDMNLRVSLKHSYTILFDFLCNYADKTTVGHYIKMDCLTFDAKGILPDEIKLYRDKCKEREFRKNSSLKYRNVRVEHFDFDNRTRIFIYDEKDEIRKSHKTIDLLDFENNVK